MIEKDNIENEKNNNSIIGAIDEVINNFTNALASAAEKMLNVLSSEFMKGFSNALNNFIKKYNEAQANPDSFFNWYNYKEALDSFHWAWPYEITAYELNALLNNINNEEEFDEFMVKYFDKSKIEKMFLILHNNVPKHHRVMLKQIKNAVVMSDYAISNNAIMSIVDNLLAKYLENKGQTKRKGILDPIIHYYQDNYPLKDINFIFELCMLSSNIDFIFQEQNFNKNIKVVSNKKVRRHSSLHGIRYSNKRVDTMMLLNTLCALAAMQAYLGEFNGALVYNPKNKVFEISSKKKEKLEKKRVKEVIMNVIDFSGEIDHKTLLNALNHMLPPDMNEKGKYLSSLLQTMKRTDKLITSKKIEGKTYWYRDAVNE